MYVTVLFSFLLLVGAAATGFGANTCAACAGRAYVEWADARPMIGRPGQKVELRYRIRGTNITGAKMELLPNRQLVDMRDTGNGVYALDVTLPTPAPHEVFRPEYGIVRGLNGVTASCYDNAFLQVRTPEIPDARIVPISATAQRSDFLVNIVLPEVFPPNDKEDFTFDAKRAARRFYELFPDEFDMLNFVLIPSYYENRYHFMVKNTVDGLGAPRLDVSAEYGSRGRLQGITVFPLSHYFDGSETGAVHETGHQWMAFANADPFTVPPHWPISTMASGIMGWGQKAGQGLNLGCTFAPEGDALVPGFRNGPPKFNDFDLYLMGLKRPGEIADQYVVTNSALWNTLSDTCSGKIPAGQFRKVTINDLIRINGTRQGPAATSIRVATVLLTRDGLADADTMAFFDFFARRFQEKGRMHTKIGYATSWSEPFASATGGLAEMTSNISPVNLPEIKYNGVANIGGFTLAGKLAPGSLGAIFGLNLSNQAVTAQSLPLPTTLGGVRVLVNGSPAPIHYVSPTQVTFQVPYETQMPVKSTDSNFRLFTVRVDNAAGSSNLAFVNGRPNAPGLFVYGDNLAIAQDADYNLLGPNNPARRGGAVVLYYTGASQLSKAIPTGAATPTDELVRVTAPVSIQLNNANFPAAFAGMVPGGIGFGQINFIVPPAFPPGTHNLSVFIGSEQSNVVKLIVQ